MIAFCTYFCIITYLCCVVYDKMVQSKYSLIMRRHYFWVKCIKMIAIVLILIIAGVLVKEDPGSIVVAVLQLHWEMSTVYYSMKFYRFKSDYFLSLYPPPVNKTVQLTIE